MPIILRIIAQRAIAGMVAILTFLGLAPEATIPTNEEIVFRIEEQRRIVEQILELRPTEFISDNYRPNSVIEVIGQTAEKINERRESVENNPTQSEIKLKNEVRPIKPIVTADPKSDNLFKNNIQKEEDFINSPTTTKTFTDGQMKNLSDVIVNIICTEKGQGFTKASSGSGVLISPNGVVLTNAHVAQFFLLEDSSKGVECGIYRENIPTFGYRADLIYISPIWVEENKTLIREKDPRGTGRKDYAFLQITENTNPVLGLPSNFSYAPIMLDTDIYTKERRVEIGGFPGTPLSIIDLTKAGSLQTDNSEIFDVFTIDGKEIDLISTKKSSVAAKGASGGGIFYNNKLIGITVTVSEVGDGFRINALTTDYINRDLKNEAGFTIGDIVNKNSSIIKRNFQENYLENLAGAIYQNL